MKQKLSQLVLVLLMLLPINVQASEESQITIGLQLWSVRDKLNDDFNGTIEELADMGFEALEFAGVFGEFKDNPKGLKNYLLSLGITVSGAHVSFEALSEQNREKTFSFYRELGANYLVIPYDERAWHPVKINEFIAELNHYYPIVTAAGFAFGFHNHEKEFYDYEQYTYWDHIAQKSDPNMVLQLDIGWVNYIGKDPEHYVKAYPDRTLTTHYKIRTHQGKGQSPILGQDSYDWASLFTVMKAHGGTKWIIVEQEEYPEGMSSLESVKHSKAGLERLLKKADLR